METKIEAVGSETLGSRLKQASPMPRIVVGRYNYNGMEAWHQQRPLFFPINQKNGIGQQVIDLR